VEGICMGSDNRRRAVRIECDLPVRLEADGGDLAVRLVDLSRTGVRLRVPGELLGVHRLSSLAQVTKRLREILGDVFDAELHYEMLGPLVRKTLRPRRIAKQDWEHSDVDVGCHLDQPITDEEAGMLGTPLPTIGSEEIPIGLEGVGPQRREAAPPPLRPAPPVRDPQSFTAWLYPEAGKSSKPLRTETLSLTRGMAMLQVGKGQGWDLHELPVAKVIEALDQAYGTGILLRIVEGPDDVWAGPAEILEVEVAPESCDIRVGVSFGRQLRSEELGRLGLPTPA
jgi:hypothetical protein